MSQETLKGIQQKQKHGMMDVFLAGDPSNGSVS